MSSSEREQPELELARKIEAILFIAPDGASVSEIAAAAEYPPSAVRRALAFFSDGYGAAHGMEIRELGGKWFMASAPDMNKTLELFRAADESEHVRLSRASLETLAVVAYNQPVTRSEIEEIRGVRCDRVIDTLLDHRLVRIAGRRKSTGSPLLYRTTEKFLEIFGLGAISDLPTVAEIEELRNHQPRARADEAAALSLEEAAPVCGGENNGEENHEIE